ncbi:MAG: plastocyanin/azurin family copper-binding protein [Terriglobales bacterium]
MRKASAAWMIAALCGLVWAASPAAFQLIVRQARSFRSLNGFPHDSPEVTLDRTANRIQSAKIAQLQLTALAGPKARMMSFQIDTLSNPEIRIPKGIRLTLNVINIDDDMVHDLYITDRPPPYPSKFDAGKIGTPMLRPYQKMRYSGTALVLKATDPGTLYYVCSVPGHARAGMYGKIVITP